MNLPLRIRPADLEGPPYQKLVQTLAFQWAHANLLHQIPGNNDHVTTIRTLLLTTQDPERTQTIVQAILDQATRLHKTSAWVEQEIKFEGMITGADRADFLLFELHQAGTIDDDLLDSYNLRLNRFTTTE
ncbi:hypothetical protein ACFQ4C_21025 [Larkinella insperata]|uniref:Uncharacterized protein n=1 Tax=Larkinella insperata TaxID=332158 RepID=A0ABW3QKX8_9BACT